MVGISLLWLRLLGLGRPLGPRTRLEPLGPRRLARWRTRRPWRRTRRTQWWTQRRPRRRSPLIADIAQQPNRESAAGIRRRSCFGGSGPFATRLALRE